MVDSRCSSWYLAGALFVYILRDEVLLFPLRRPTCAYVSLMNAALRLSEQGGLGGTIDRLSELHALLAPHAASPRVVVAAQVAGCSHSCACECLRERVWLHECESS